jgi:hypothetical protein
VLEKVTLPLKSSALPWNAAKLWRVRWQDGRMTMGDVVIPIREGAASGPCDVAHAVGSAFQKTVQKLPMSGVHLPHRHACTILLNFIVQCAGRGMRDVDQLSEAALAHLREGEEKI